MVLKSLQSTLSRTQLPTFILKQTSILLNDLLSEVLRDGNEDEDVGGGEGVDECDGLKRGCKLEAMAA